MCAQSMNAMHNQQMELMFNNAQACQPRSRRRHRPYEASWWFARMRQVVDGAFDWRPALPPRPEQRWLPYRG
jgi:hypothetical protein